MRIRSIYLNYGACWLLLSVCGSARAQKAPELDQLIRFASPITLTQEKHIHEGIQGQEAGAQVWVDRPNSEVKVRAHVVLDREALEGTWTAQGMHIIYIGAIVVGEVVERTHRQVLPEDFPIFIDTGDPAGDNAAYDAAKAAWIAAHPGEYEYMSVPPATTSDPATRE